MDKTIIRTLSIMQHLSVLSEDRNKYRHDWLFEPPSHEGELTVLLCRGEEC